MNSPAILREPPLRRFDFWRRLALQAPLQKLERNFWDLYLSSFLVDLGLCLHFFLFSLLLVEHHFDERAIGFISAALTLGTIAGLLPANLLVQRLGLRPMMLAYLVLAPLCLALRAFFLQMPAQLALAFLAGAAMSIWSVCFSPTLAKLTTQENRVFGFSLFVATGIASGALAGLIGGYFPGFVRYLVPSSSSLDGIQIVLLLACAVIGMAGFGVLRLPTRKGYLASFEKRKFTSFLLRILIAIAVWNFSLGFFTPFANVYLSRHLNLPVERIGAIYSVSQLLQVGAVLAAPLLYRKVGLVTGIALTQAGTAFLLWMLARVSTPSAAIHAYLLLSALQWMSVPGITSLLMNGTAAEYRSHASAMQNLVNLSAQACSAALAGRIFEHFGYAALSWNAVIAAVAVLLLYTLLPPRFSAEHSLQSSSSALN
jgi:MFS family permease